MFRARLRTVIPNGMSLGMSLNVSLCETFALNLDVYYELDKPS